MYSPGTLGAWTKVSPFQKKDTVVWQEKNVKTLNLQKWFLKLKTYVFPHSTADTVL